MYRILIVSNNSYADLFYNKFNNSSFKNFKVELHDDFVIDRKSLNEFDVIVFQIKYPLFQECFELIEKLRAEYSGVLVVVDSYSVLKHKLFCNYNKIDLYYDLDNGFADLFVKIRFLIVGNRMSGYDAIEYKDIKMDLKTRNCYRLEQLVVLRNKEFELLKFLIENPERIFSVTQILEAVWDMNADLNTNTVQTHISTLRKKIDIGFSEKRLHTVNCIGYKLE